MFSFTDIHCNPFYPLTLRAIFRMEKAFDAMRVDGRSAAAMLMDDAMLLCEAATIQFASRSSLDRWNLFYCDFTLSLQLLNSRRLTDQERKYQIAVGKTTRWSFHNSLKPGCAIGD